MNNIITSKIYGNKVFTNGKKLFLPVLLWSILGFRKFIDMNNPRYVSYHFLSFNIHTTYE